MAEAWFYKAGSIESGPMTRDELEAAARAGRFSPADRVRRSHSGEWVEPSDGLFPQQSWSSTGRDGITSSPSLAGWAVRIHSSGG